MPNYAKMDVDELQEKRDQLSEKIVAANVARDEQSAKAKEKILGMQTDLDELTAVLNLKQRLGTLNDTEKAALSRVIEAGGIESSEEVGTPGAN